VKPLYKTSTISYWHDFKVNDTDLDQLYELTLAKGSPCTLDTYVHKVIEARCQQEVGQLAARRKGKVVYQPAQTYTVGQKLSFAAIGHRAGEVIGIRQGANHRYGSFEVISVQLESPAETREFVSAFPVEHPLNLPVGPTQEAPQPDDLFEAYGSFVKERLAEALRTNPEFVSIGNLWLLKGLLLDIHVGHLNIAEAMIDVGRSPLSPAELVEELDLSPDADLPLQRFSLNYALLQDERFINVGTEEKPLWYLARLKQD